MLETLRKSIMLVDDNLANLGMGKTMLKNYYEVYALPSAERMFAFLQNVTPDLILLDINMPEIDGYEAIRRLKATRRFAHIPVIFLTAKGDEASELEGFSLGAVDYVSKPFSPPILLKRIENQLLIEQQKRTIQHHADNLSQLVGEKTKEVLNLQNAILNTVADLVEFRDKPTGGHITRTQLYLKALIEELLLQGRYTEDILRWDMDFVLPSAQLHDVGKVAISDQILNKPGQFSPREFEIMKTHVEIGLEAVSRMLKITKENAFLRHAQHFVGTHHEWWDGSGYPLGLSGPDIPLEGRLMAVADVYDALISWRPYKKELSHAEAKAIIESESGTHFDPVLVGVFLSAEEHFVQISESHGSFPV